MSGYPEYLVIKRQRCGVCEGTGYVMHPLWKEMCDELVTPLSDEMARQWFREKGCDVPPPEEVECEVCNGRGYIEFKVPLTEALRELGVWNEC